LIRYDKFTAKNNNYIWLEFTTITIKKSQLLNIVCTLILFTMINSANAAIIASDDTSITGIDQSSAQTVAVSPASFSDVVLTLDELGDAGQAQSAENYISFVDSTSSKSPHRDSHVNLWLLLIVASVIGVLSEILHRRSSNR
jgi:hypothetical protein